MKNTIIFFSLLGDYSHVSDEIERELSNPPEKPNASRNITPEFIDKLSIADCQNLAKELLAQCKKLKSENSALKEESEKITEIANRTSVALAELKQGISDAIDVSEAYFNTEQE